MKIYCITFLALIFSYGTISAQVVQQTGSVAAWVHNHIINDMPIENSGGFAKPSSADLSRFRSIFDLILDENYSNAADSLNAHFSSYELVQLTDSTVSNAVYYVLREHTITKGWGTYIYNPNYQRDVLVGVPHPLFDSNTPYEGVDMLHFLGARFFAMAGTHRCAGSDFTTCSGETTACSGGGSEKFRISDMAHNDSTVFQRAHEAMLSESPNAFFLNLHGHNRASCEDVFISNGREDDTKPILQTLRDSLLANGIDVAVPGDVTDCTLFGSTNTQGRLVNGSSDPCGTSNVTNSGKFFHIEQSVSSRKAQSEWKILIQEIGDMIPRSFNTVTLPEFPQIAINEIHFFPIEPSGDANGNGSVQTISDEFVEIVNSGTTPFNLTGWKLSDNTQVRHEFPSGTVLVSGGAVVVFGGTFSGDFGGSFVQTASTAQLNLNNSSETVIINAPTGAPIFSVSYDTSNTQFNGGTLVRNPDVTGNFVYHSVADSDDNSWFSPGRKINGDPFVPFAQITNVAGWRMLSTPSNSYLLRDLESYTAIQGIGTSETPNLYTSFNGTSWTKPNSLDETLSSGNGFIVYFFNNSLHGSTPLPITLRAGGNSPTQDVSIGLHANGNKFNLIGNPFNAPIDFSLISPVGGSLTSVVGHIWDPQANAYTTTFAWNDEVGAWQGVMLENNDATSLTIPSASIIQNGKFANGDQLKEKHSSRSVWKLSFTLSDDNEENIAFDQLFLVIDEEAGDHISLMNAKKLAPLEASVKSFAWKVPEDTSRNTFIQRAFSELNQTLEIDEFGLQMGSLTIHLDRLYGNFEQVRLHFLDLSNSQEFFLDENQKNLVSAQKSSAMKSSISDEMLLESKNTTRWKVRIEPKSATSTEPSISSLTFELNQNFPNPFNPNTVIHFSIPQSEHVTLEIVSILGESIAVLVDKPLSAGQHNISFTAENMSSGLYLYRLTTPSGVITRKMILMK